MAEAQKAGDFDLLETVFGVMIIFPGILYFSAGPAKTTSHFSFRTILFVVGVIGYGALKLRQRNASGQGGSYAFGRCA